ncbi:MAG: AAA family ATPase [Methanobrevibacter sp.]|jgi:hypothetical protein|nr:AAA family ATPase [Candidatus Methanoflexus mossambicus]
MNKSVKNLPTTISYFSTLIENDYIYVDKTKEIYELIEHGKNYILTRPRRFGKSLLLSTMEELFKGNKKLFEGLYIYDKWDWSQSYPILKIDMSGRSVESPEVFKKSLNYLVDKIAKKEDIELFGRTLKFKFGQLIKNMYKKYGKRIVILVDEYDYPITDNIENIEVAEANRKILTDFYQVLKSSNEYIEFIFLTGITKFVMTSIFSKLNNLDDITIDSRYSTICGFKDSDLEKHFSYYIEELSKREEVSYDETLKLIKEWYYGYSWDGENFLYNPIAILSTFFNKRFANYWFDTGIPYLFMDLVKSENIDLTMFTDSELRFYGNFPIWDLNNVNFITVLLQTGYLTIKEKTKSRIGKDKYLLGIANKEVKLHLFSYLISPYTHNNPNKLKRISSRFLKYLLNRDENKLSETVTSLIENVQYDSNPTNWKNYRSLFAGFFLGTGLDVLLEKSNSEGSIEYVLKVKDIYIIAGLKYDQNKTLYGLFDETWSQIAKNKYYQPYQNKNLIFLTIAINDSEDVKEVQCQIKTLEEIKKIKNNKV